MKTIQLLIAGFFILMSSVSNAQVSVNFNIGSRPNWGPAGFTEVNYYYLPDIQTYYDLRTSNFIYVNNGRWIRSRNLPIRYRNYDLYNGYKVVLTDYNGNRPYQHFNKHKLKYGRNHGPKTIVVREVRHKDHPHKKYKKHKHRHRD